jgi:hypothetical protein
MVPPHLGLRPRSAVGTSNPDCHWSTDTSSPDGDDFCLIGLSRGVAWTTPGHGYATPPGSPNRNNSAENSTARGFGSSEGFTRLGKDTKAQKDTQFALRSGQSRLGLHNVYSLFRAETALKSTLHSRFGLSNPAACNADVQTRASLDRDCPWWRSKPRGWDGDVSLPTPLSMLRRPRQDSLADSRRSSDPGPGVGRVPTRRPTNG